MTGPEQALRILWVSPYAAPSLSGGGEQLRQASLLVRIGSHHRVHLVAPAAPVDPDVQAAVAEVTVVDEPPLRPTRVPPRLRLLGHALVGRDPLVAVAVRRRTTSFSPVVERLEPHADVILVEHIEFARIARDRGSRRWVLTAHYVPSRQARHLANVTRGRWRWLWKGEISRCARLERWAGERYDALVAVSEPDAASLAGSVALVPNGVTLASLPTPLPSSPNLLFLGSLDTRANIDGLSWFISQVWPRVRTGLPEARLVVAGRAPGGELRSRLSSSPGVELRPDVPDIQPVLEHARVVLVPLRIGSGTRLKALQGLAAGRVVVGTTIGLEGLALQDGVHAAVADTAQDLATAIVRVCQDDDLAHALVQAGRDHVEQHFGWDDCADRLDALLRRLAGAGGS